MYNNDEKINLEDLYYYRERNRNKVYAAVISAFSNLVETRNLTKREIAFRLGKEPAQITRWLSGPGNWTLDTVSDLLLAMGAELDHEVDWIDENVAQAETHPLLKAQIGPKVIQIRQNITVSPTGTEQATSTNTPTFLTVRVG